MLTRAAFNLTRARGALFQSLRRNFGASAVVCQKATAGQNLDPIQKLFLDKVREYDQKSKAAGGKMVGATPEVEKNLTDSLDKLKRQYGADSADFLTFPSFNFTDPTLEPVGVQAEAKEQQVAEVEAAFEEEDDDKPYWEP